MESRISTKIDFENGNEPIIEIFLKSSDDTRDEILQTFIQSKSHTSRWLTIEYKGERNKGLVYQLRIVKPEQIPQELKLMEAVVKQVST